MKYIIYYEDDYLFTRSSMVETEADNLYDLIRKLEHGDVIDEENNTTVYADAVTQIDVIKQDF